MLFRQLLSPGKLRKIGRSKFVFIDKASSKNGGLRSFQLRCNNRTCNVTVQAYGDLSAATVPTMAAQVLIGDDIFINKASWTKTRQGWKQLFPRHP